MFIREATVNDLEELNAFYIRMNEVINVRSEKYNPDNPVFPSKEMIIEAISTHGQFVGIEDNRIVIACIVNHNCAPAYEQVKWPVHLEKNEFYILHALRVLPEYERRGYAKMMLEFLYQIAKEREQKALRLDVLEGYNVDAFYRSCGFMYIDTIDILYDDIGCFQKFRLFEKQL